MEFGINNCSPLLSITIPTWNRANTLEGALNSLLPQVSKFCNEIEIIISDNASEDNTKCIVEKYIQKYSEIDIIYNRNEKNIQFFGNFKKCKEMARGKYIWVLSDDDFILKNVLNEIISQLYINSNEYAFIYLKNNCLDESFALKISDKDDFIKEESYRMGLISSVIFLNEKKYERFIMDRYNESAFIGFIFLLNSFNFRNKVLTISGKCLDTSKDIPTTCSNFFDIFINHMEHVINYMHFIKLPEIIVNDFRNSYLRSFIFPKYVRYKALGRMNFESSEEISLKKIEKWVKNNYSDLSSYKYYFFPLTLLPAYILHSAVISYKSLKKQFNYHGR